MESAICVRALLVDVFLPKFWSFLPRCVAEAVKWLGRIIGPIVSLDGISKKLSMCIPFRARNRLYLTTEHIGKN
jgi:hypothetical protein